MAGKREKTPAETGAWTVDEWTPISWVVGALGGRLTHRVGESVMAKKSTERKGQVTVVVHEPETRTIEVNVVDEDGNPVDPETLARVIGEPS